MNSLLQLAITSFGAFIVSLIPLTALVDSPLSKEACSSANIFEVSKCVPAEAYAGVTYLVFIGLSLVYAEIKRKGIDASTSSIEILLHDYALQKNYSQRVHAVRYAFVQAVLAGLFVANLGYPFAIRSAASMLSEWEGGGATLVANTGVGYLVIDYWWAIPLLNIPIYWMMSMNRIGAEIFISHHQLTQRRIDYYSSHSSEVTVAVKEASAATVLPSVEGAPEGVQPGNEEDVSMIQEPAGAKWNETPLFYCLLSGFIGVFMTMLVVIPKSFDLMLIFTTVTTLAVYLLCAVGALISLDRATSEGRIVGYVCLGLMGFWTAALNRGYEYGLWGIDYFLRITMSIMVGIIPLIYVWLRRLGYFPLPWDQITEQLK